MSLNKDETAVRGCNPPVSVLVVWVSCKVYFSRSTISLAVLFENWNSLPNDLKCERSLESFKNKLKSLNLCIDF